MLPIPPPSKSAIFSPASIGFDDPIRIVIPGSAATRDLLLGDASTSLPLYFVVSSSKLSVMAPHRDLGRTLVIIGFLLTTLGALVYFSPKLPFRLGRLPGDIVHRGENSTLYFPITTSIVVSVVLSFLFWLISQFRR